MQALEDILKNKQWLYSAIQLLQSKEPLENVDIQRLADLCQKEACGKEIDCPPVENLGSLKSENSLNLKLTSIGEIEGVGKLSPTKPLKFDEGNISVIYGENGSGKSSYVKLLKHVCNARDCMQEDIIADVYGTEDEKNKNAKAKIEYSENGIPKDFVWKKGSNTNDSKSIHSVKFFDETFKGAFVTGAGEVSFEPPQLALITELVNICDRVTQMLKEKIKSVDENSKIPALPYELENEEIDEIKWLKKGISWNTLEEEVKEKCEFSKDDEQLLKETVKSLEMESPLDEVEKLSTKNKHIKEIINEIKNYTDHLSSGVYENITEAKKELKRKEEAAVEVSNNIFSNENSKLEGVGNEVWQELWKAARNYSTNVAYKNKSFPVVDESVCVLCQQELSEGAKRRFVTFEAYVKGEAQRNVDEARRKLNSIISELPEIFAEEDLKTKIDASGIEGENLKEKILNTFNFFRERKDFFLATVEQKNNIEGGVEESGDKNNALKQMPETESVIKRLRYFSKEYETKIEEYSKDEGTIEREKIKNNNVKKRLMIKQWLFENKKSILKEHDRLIKNNETAEFNEKIEKAKKKTETDSLTKLKSKLSQELITDKFVERFNNELKKLNANSLKVILTKQLASKGHVYHKISLDGSDREINKVLSDGEQKIISIASFFADVTSDVKKAPFIFDDPITSLDDKFESAVIKRLIELSKERQIIVFTHRFAFVGLLDDVIRMANKNILKDEEEIDEEEIKINFVEIKMDEKGDKVGQTDAIGVFLKKPANVIRKILDHSFPAAAKAEKNGDVNYPYIIKGFCADFRIILEGAIPSALMGDIVHPLRKAINISGKLKVLSHISNEDINFCNEKWNYYSYYEHHQTPEIFEEKITLEKLREDFKMLRDRIKIWEARKNGNSKQPAKKQSTPKTHGIDQALGAASKP